MRAKDKTARRKVTAAQWVLLAVSVTVLGAGAAFVALAVIWERLTWGRNGLHPGEPKVYAPSEFGSADEEWDG